MGDPTGWKLWTEQNDIELANSSSCQHMEFVVNRALFEAAHAGRVYSGRELYFDVDRRVDASRMHSHWLRLTF
jgi:hypothetical protein